MDSDMLFALFVLAGVASGPLGMLYLLYRVAVANTPGSRTHLQRRLRLAEQDQLVANHRRDIADAIGDIRVDPTR